MKKSLTIGMVGMAVMTTSSFGQGTILLDNYNTYGPDVTYGPGSGGTVGAGVWWTVITPWTLGMYYAVGDVTASISTDPSGIAVPTTLGGGLVLGTGPGSTAQLGYWVPGEAYPSSAFPVPDTASSGGDLITLMLVAYNGTDYLTSLVRGHSTPFTMTTSAIDSPAPSRIGNFMSGFSVFPVPEPPAFVFICLGGITLFFFCRPRSRYIP